MKCWITIVASNEDVRAIYIGNSEKKAKEIADEYEDPEHGIYCYIQYYNSKLKDAGYRHGEALND